MSQLSWLAARVVPSLERRSLKTDLPEWSGVAGETPALFFFGWVHQIA
jgi:hypothetical protein